MWSITQFLKEHLGTDERDVAHEFERVYAPTLDVSELLEIDQQVRPLAHLKGLPQERWQEKRNARAVHERVHEALHARDRCDCKDDRETPQAHLAHRVVTTDQWLTLWRETACYCEGRSRQNLRIAVFHAFYRQFVWDLSTHPDPEERVRVRNLLTQTTFTLHELIEFEAWFTRLSWRWHRSEEAESLSQANVARELLSRIRCSPAPWQEWRDEGMAARPGTWLAKLCAERFIADLVATEAPFADWLQRWHDCEAADQRQPLNRALIAGLERTAQTFEDWNTVYRLVRSKGVRAYALERMMGQLL